MPEAAPINVDDSNNHNQPRVWQAVQACLSAFLHRTCQRIYYHKIIEHTQITATDTLKNIQQRRPKMELNEIKHYIQEIIALEFAERNHEIQVNVGRVKADMAARGLQISTITLSQLAEFFLGEFRARVDLIANYAITKVGMHQQQGNDEAMPSVALYKEIADAQFKFIEQAYEGSVTTILTSLQSNMPAQIRESLVERMTSYAKKNELTIEFECKAATASDVQKEVLFLRPTFCGVGVDLKALWNQHMK